MAAGYQYLFLNLNLYLNLIHQPTIHPRAKPIAHGGKLDCVSTSRKAAGRISRPCSVSRAVGRRLPRERSPR